MAKTALMNLTYGLQVLTTCVDGLHNGCIINTTSQIVSDPIPVISIAVNKANHTCAMIEKSNKFTVSILSEDAKFDTFKHFGFQSGKNVNKFEGYTNYKLGANDTAIITEGTNSYIQAWVTQKIDMGTHMLFIATVTDQGVLTDTPSATYAYYHAHIKPQPQTKKDVWVCDICGYIYDPEKGDPDQGVKANTKFEDLPDSYVCPLCKHPKSDFSKQ